MPTPAFSQNQLAVLDMIEQIERARSGMVDSDKLEEKLWRLLDSTGLGFPPTLAGQVDELVQSLRRLRNENRAFAHSTEVDENRGADGIYNEVVNALSRYLDS
jgi:hypothetical protein